MVDHAVLKTEMVSIFVLDHALQSLQLEILGKNPQHVMSLLMSSISIYVYIHHVTIYIVYMQ